MLRYALFMCVLGIGCGDNEAARPDGATPTPDAPSSALRHCIDSPETIVIAPANQLPCDLLPPGFGQ